MKTSRASEPSGESGGQDLRASGEKGSAHSCSKIVFGQRVQHWQCNRVGVIERGGKWFCRVHDPQRNDVSADAEKIWAWDTFSDKPTPYFVARRTEKEITTRKGSPTGYPTRFYVRDIGTVYFVTELDAWRWRVESKQRSIKNLEYELHAERTQLGIAESRVRAMESASSPPRVPLTEKG